MEDKFEFDLAVPNFSKPKNNGKGKNFYKECLILNNSFPMRLRARLCSNGSTPESEGYVSIMLCPYLFFNTFWWFNCEVCIVDANNELRCCQTFGGDSTTQMISPNRFRFTSSIGLDKFIRRDDLLAPSADYLSADTLNLRFFVTLHLNYQEPYNYDKLKKVADQESWFIELNSPDGAIVNCLQLNNPYNALCTRLRKQSSFFKCLFKPHTKESVQGFMPIDKDEYNAFFNLMYYIRFKTLKHVQDNENTIERYCDLYMVADKYQVLELKESCSMYLKHHLSNETAAGIFAVADLCYDPDLRKLALERIILNWQIVHKTDGWRGLRRKRPGLRNEVLRLLENNELNLEGYDLDQTEESYVPLAMANCYQ